jgi:hypothetical protein
LAPARTLAHRLMSSHSPHLSVGLSGIMRRYRKGRDTGDISRFPRAL